MKAGKRRRVEVEACVLAEAFTLAKAVFTQLDARDVSASQAPPWNEVVALVVPAARRLAKARGQAIRKAGAHMRALGALDQAEAAAGQLVAEITDAAYGAADAAVPSEFAAVTAGEAA